MSIKKNVRKLSHLEQILFLIVFFLVVIIISGTILAFALNKAEFAAGMREIDPTPEQTLKTEELMDVYTGIGELRALTADNPHRTLVIAPYFSYNKNDSALYEELVQKNKKIRARILDYIINYSQEELVRLGEGKVKADLMRLVNSELILGKIDKIYFTEYIFF